jgi:hypothetical protein
MVNGNGQQLTFLALAEKSIGANTCNALSIK